MTGRPFSSVLVANRGEIALRVIRAARAAGLRSIAVYSDADVDAPHVRAADDAVHIGPTRATESYLSIEAILRAARDSGAEALHPGYGFLSERPAFARAVEEADLVFVGPSATVMDQMGRKDRAREVAERAGVPVMPRYDEDAVPADAYPVLVKAAAGGGGKGMRIVRAPGELAPAIASARREAASAFGDDTLLIEEYVEAGRHVEAQVIGDHHGNVLHLFERDCSVQRRHQKALEEAPAPTISAAVRATLLASSVALARQVGYVNAGTVEFLVWGDEHSGEHVAFLEMNTRLQVEHPVTELVTGIDLVQWQLAVAAGEAITVAQDAITCTGHAFEARVYAEDPYAGFLPQAGRAGRVVWPAGARVDAALESGQEVSTAYDPMLGKIVVHGSTRELARLALVRALDETAVFGLTTNIGFLRALAASKAYADVSIHTAWLDDAPEAAWLSSMPDPPGRAGRLAALGWATTHVEHAPHPFATGDGWRSGGAGAPINIELLDHDGQLQEHTFAPSELRHAVSPLVDVDVDGATVVVDGMPWTFTRPDPDRSGAVVAGEADLVSPMPGTVLSVNVEQGATVHEGEVLGVVEAMKMELALRAPYDGTVTHVGVVAGEGVALGHLLFRVDPELFRVDPEQEAQP